MQQTLVFHIYGDYDVTIIFSKKTLQDCYKSVEGIDISVPYP